MHNFQKLIILSSFLFLQLFCEAQVISQIAPINKNISGDVDEGYLFIVQSTLDTTGTYPTALCLLDSIGEPVFFKACTKQISAPYTRIPASDFKLQPSGLLSYSTRLANGKTGMYLMNSDFKIIDSIQCVNGFLTDGHDFIHLPDGSYHIVGTEERIMDLSGILTVDGFPGDDEATVTGNVIQSFDNQKSLQFEWKSLDHFSIDDVYSHFFTDASELDHSHYNSLDIDNDGNYILSFRHLHEIAKVDAITGEVIWRFGGKNNQFTFLEDTMRFSAQHDARRISNGNLTLFDNGTYNSIQVARALEYELNENEMTAKAVWQFQEPNGYSSQFIGNTNRLPNGNTLIDWGGALPLTKTISFTEVDAIGSIVMELDFVPNRYISYRAVKHQMPFAINRPKINCDGQSMTLSAPSGYVYYEWNTGSKMQSITIVDTGSYQVWVNQGIGFVSSEKYHVSNLDSICNSTDITEVNKQVIKIYPNPVSHQLFVEFLGIKPKAGQIINSSGQLIKNIELSANNNIIVNSIDVSELTAGFYILKFGNTKIKFIKN